jgi:hypothetical protein
MLSVAKALYVDGARMMFAEVRAVRFASLGVRVLIAIKRHQLRSGALPTALTEIPADLWSGIVPPLEQYEYRLKPDGTFLLRVLGHGLPRVVNVTANRAASKGLR